MENDLCNKNVERMTTQQKHKLEKELGMIKKDKNWLRMNYYKKIWKNNLSSKRKIERKWHMKQKLRKNGL